MLIIGTLQNYVHTMQLRQKWQLRQKNITMGQDPAKSSASQIQKELNGYRLTAISDKLKAGQRLTSSEMDFLRNNSPALYRKAVAIEKERKAFARELKSCKTKEEVAQVYARKMQGFAVEVKATDKMAPAERQEALADIQMQSAAMVDEYTRFLASKDYPTESEEDKKKSLHKKRYDVRA